MAFLDGLLVNVALPVMQRELSIDVGPAQWIIEAYLLLLSSLVLVGGALGDCFGRRRAFLAGVALFALASARCGAAPGARMGIGDARVVALLAAGGVGLVAFVLVERRAPSPMVPLDLFRWSPTFAGTNLLTLMLYGALGGRPLLSSAVRFDPGPALLADGGRRRALALRPAHLGDEPFARRHLGADWAASAARRRPAPSRRWPSGCSRARRSATPTGSPSCRASPSWASAWGSRSRRSPPP